VYRDHPLALYVFTQDDKVKTKVFDNTQSGAAVANEVVIHPGTDGLPFGGIGPSGRTYHFVLKTMTPNDNIL